MNETLVESNIFLKNTSNTIYTASIHTKILYIYGGLF